jgi:hypothetical protein
VLFAPIAEGAQTFLDGPCLPTPCKQASGATARAPWYKYGARAPFAGIWVLAMVHFLVSLAPPGGGYACPAAGARAGWMKEEF